MAVKLKALWASTIVDFDYTGGVQEYTAPATGYYKLEVWGAQGGTAYHRSVGGTNAGGKGGYSVGVIHLSSGTSIYGYVGGKGTDYITTYRGSISGGYNGGGSANMGGYAGKNCLNAYGCAGSGGGSTDFSALNSTWNNNNHLYSRIIVAGGGGGANSHASIDSYAGSGGGSIGERCQAASTDGGSVYDGGSQVAGGTACWWGNEWPKAENGSFGKGGNGIETKHYTGEYYASNPGGGGGWYGGGAGVIVGASGGSGWVYTASTFAHWAANSTEGRSGNWKLNSNYYLSSASTAAGNTTFKSPSGTIETGHSGNGYARITYLGVSI